jgi:pimeloyl-ACP methyl ester carboxylesterase
MSRRHDENVEASFVLVPGGWQDAWIYERVVARLRELGREALALTLTGLDPDAPAASRAANLDTHIGDVVDVLGKLAHGNVVLCGHSYGGMVITPVADRLPGRVGRLVYIDAYVPADGDSCWSLISERYRRLIVAGAGTDGNSSISRDGPTARSLSHTNACGRTPAGAPTCFRAVTMSSARRRTSSPRSCSTASGAETSPPPDYSGLSHGNLTDA